MEQNKTDNPTEVLSFRNGIRMATIVTDGEHHRSFECDRQASHPTLIKAISYLESRGYTIITDQFNGL